MSKPDYLSELSLRKYPRAPAPNSGASACVYPFQWDLCVFCLSAVTVRDVSVRFIGWLGGVLQKGNLKLVSDQRDACYLVQHNSDPRVGIHVFM